MFGDLYVIDCGEYRHMRFGSADGIDQSVVFKRDYDAATSEYVSAACLSLLFAARRQRVLIAGLGGGALPRTVRRLFPATRIDVVEIDPAVIRCAKQHFGVVEDRMLRIHTGDIAEHLRSYTRKPYDIAILDAFDDRGMPRRLTSQRFYGSVRSALATAGLAVVNIAFGQSSQQRAVVRRVRDTWPASARFRSEYANNLLLFASLERGPLSTVSHCELLRRAERIDQRPGCCARLTAMARRLERTGVPTTPATAVK